MSFIESYERKLVEAAERRRDARLGNRVRRLFAAKRRRQGLAVVLAALVAGVPAAAATVGGWNPFDDPGRDARAGKPPSVSQRAVDPALTAQLGVLRREQTPGDRGAVTSERLRGADDAFRGAQLEGVRLVDRDRGVVLVPFEQMPVPRDAEGRALPGFEDAQDGNVVCVFEPTADGFGGVGCHNAQKIDRGLALASGSGQISGLVPDGVARVRLIRGDDSAEAPVQDNFFSAAEPAPTAPRVVEWLAADGSLVKRIDLNAERARP